MKFKTPPCPLLEEEVGKGIPLFNLLNFSYDEKKDPAIP
jgi:hypothetical protein